MSDYLKIGLRFLNLKNYSSALEEFLRIDKDPSDFLDLSYYFGICYTNLKKYDKALLYLEQVVTNHTDILMVYQCRLILSYIYSITGRYKLAEFELKELIDAGFESAQIYGNLSYISYSQRLIDKSLEYLGKASELEPDNPNILNSMGYILANEDLDSEESIVFCKKAVKLKNEYPAYLDSLGWAYFKAGKNNEALLFLRKALSLAGSNKIIASHIKTVLGEIK
ncbi:MAG: tetratricopeptide repeat protein [Spirochaetia bacterium]|jgi:tetratricopeptide (TPR) repeat protein|nr:tetratricopeptide repeat protein [Spirochaetia bacterium]